MRYASRKALVATGLMLICGLAGAQAYRCNVNGATVYSDRPCSGPVAPVKSEPLPAVPPPPPARYVPATPYVPTQGKPADYVRHLSAECAQLNEGVRTARARGNRWNTVQELQEEYRRKCAEDDYNARMVQGEQARQEWANKRAERAAAGVERQQAQRQSERCVAMRDVIQTKRARAGQLTDADRESLRSLEATYNTQCVGGT